MRTRAFVAAALAAVVPAHAHAQCRVAGDVDVAEVTLGPVTLTSIHLDAAEVRWPDAATGPSRARLRTPFDADVRISSVSFHVDPAGLPSELFEVAAEAQGPTLEHVGGLAVVRIDGVHVHDVDVACAAVRLGAISSARGATLGAIGSRRMTGELRIHAQPTESAPSVRLRLRGAAPVALDIVERRGGWTRVALIDAGVTLTGWLPTDAAAEHRDTSGTGGFSGRSAVVREWPVRRDGCYEGPALLRDRTPIYLDATTTTPWGHVVDADTLLFRDCGGARVEVVAAMRRTATFGWIDGTDVARMGLRVCGPDLTVFQSPATMRLFVAESTAAPLRGGDEIVRHGADAIVGPPFDTVTPVWPELVCEAWRDRTRLVVLRDGARLEVGRGGD